MVSYTLEGTRLSYNFYEMANCLLAGTFPPVPLFHIGLCICYMCYDSQFHLRKKKKRKVGVNILDVWRLQVSSLFCNAEM